MAWAAGLFEGEGSITHTRNSGRQSRQRWLTLSMTDGDVVRRFARVVACGTVKLHERTNPRWEPIYKWTCSRWADTERVLRAFLPYLGKRRSAKARLLLADPAGPVGGPVKSHCKRGHPLRGEGSDVYVHNKVLHCRACQRERAGVRAGGARCVDVLRQLGGRATAAEIAEVLGLDSVKAVGCALGHVARAGGVVIERANRSVAGTWVLMEGAKRD